eukprot:COSAG02_NODE_7031_length_3219_cov_1.591987_4_plen_79_part_00
MHRLDTQPTLPTCLLLGRYALAPSSPRTPAKVNLGGERATGASADRKTRRRQKAAGSDVEALHGKLGDALSLLGTMLD